MGASEITSPSQKRSLFQVWIRRAPAILLLGFLSLCIYIRCPVPSVTEQGFSLYDITPCLHLLL
jgi:hypothetical protein